MDLKIEFCEQATLSRERWDKVNRTMYGVIILRPSMQEGQRIYEQQALDDVVRLVNARAAPVLINHRRNGMPDTEEIAGRVENARIDNLHVVRGDLVYTRSHQDKLEDLIETLREQVGLSLHCIGVSVVRSDGVEIVSSIKQIKSIDIVSYAGHSSGLWEAMKPDKDDEEYRKFAAVLLDVPYDEESEWDDEFEKAAIGPTRGAVELT